MYTPETAQAYDEMDGTQPLTGHRPSNALDLEMSTLAHADHEYRVRLSRSFQALGYEVGQAPVFGRTRAFYRRGGGEWTSRLR